jgi:hypothetical protein
MPLYDGRLKTMYRSTGRRDVRQIAAWLHVAISLGITPTLPAGVSAQSEPSSTSLQGTLAYNLTWTNTSAPPTGYGASIGRFSGRASVRLRPYFYVGAGVSSWQYEIALSGTFASPSGVYDEVVTAVVLSSQAQLYPFHTERFFVRGGFGVAQIHRYQRQGSLIIDFPSTHMSATTGAGVDIPVRSHVSVTLSADYTSILGVEYYREAKSSLLAGIGLTVH